MRLASRHCIIALFALLVTLSPAAAGEKTGPRILALGSTGALDPAAIQAATGAEVVGQLGDEKLQTYAVILLANVAFASLPPAIQDGLADYVTAGGTVCFTGGAEAFGSGGYHPLSAVLPFELRSASDWRAVSFRPTIVLQPGHPALAGVEFGTVGSINDMNVRSGAVELLRSAGGGGRTGGRAFPYPLMAEMGIGSGRVLGVAFSLQDAGATRDPGRFMQNALGYLLGASRAGTATP